MYSSPSTDEQDTSPRAVGDHCHDFIKELNSALANNNCTTYPMREELYNKKVECIREELYNKKVECIFHIKIIVQSMTSVISMPSSRHISRSRNMIYTTLVALKLLSTQILKI